MTINARPRNGFTLIEIMVAMTILAITLGGFAGLTVQYMRRARTASATVAKTAVLNEQVQRLTVLTFDSLAARSGCQTFSNSPIPHTRCISMATINSNSHKRVTIIIRPTDTSIRPETTFVDRTKPPTGNPLNVP